MQYYCISFPVIKQHHINTNTIFYNIHDKSWNFSFDIKSGHIAYLI
jgi:hypothetical protein